MDGEHISKNKTYQGNDTMEWINNFINSITLSELIPHLIIVSIIVVIGAFSLAAFNSHYKHLKLLEQIKQGLDPDS
jgi:hypothetical protein